MPKPTRLLSGIAAQVNCTTFLVITIVHVGCRHTVIVTKEARSQVHELKSYVCRLLLVLNNGYSIHGIDSGQHTLLNIICRLCSFIFIGHVSFLYNYYYCICKRCNCGLILHKSKRM